MAHQKLHELIVAGKWNQLDALLGAMSNTEFRRAEHFVRTSVLPQLDNDHFWAALLHLVHFRRQAFLTGVLAVNHLVADATLQFDSPSARTFADYLLTEHPSSVQKVVNMVLPLLKDEGQVLSLFQIFRIESNEERIVPLLKVDSPLAYYFLFNALRHIPDNKPLVLDCCRYILRRADDYAYNMVAILQAYFGLHELRGQFSLRIEPYELSQLDRDPQVFYHLLNGKRPQL